MGMTMVCACGRWLDVTVCKGKASCVKIAMPRVVAGEQKGSSEETEREK